MIRNLFYIAILCTGFVACGSKKAAYNYSQDIVTKERSLEPEIAATEDKVEKFAGAGQFDSVAAVSQRMETLVQKKIDEINAMKVPDVKEADNFKAAIMRYFKYIKSIYTGYRQVAIATDDEKRQQLAKDLLELAGNKTTELNKMQEMQRKYAKANGLKMEN